MMRRLEFEWRRQRRADLLSLDAGANLFHISCGCQKACSAELFDDERNVQSLFGAVSGESVFRTSSFLVF